MKRLDRFLKSRFFTVGLEPPGLARDRYSSVVVPGENVDTTKPAGTGLSSQRPGCEDQDNQKRPRPD